MDARIVANELNKVADALEIIAASAEVPNYIWESLKKIFGMNREASTVAKLMLKTDSEGNPVVTANAVLKCKAIAIGARSIEKKLEELGHPEIKLSFSGVTFDDNAKKLGIPEEEYMKTVEPPQKIVEDIITAREGGEVEYKKRVPGGSASSKVNLDEVQNHKAFIDFKEKFLDVLGDKVTYKVTKSEDNMGVLEDTVEVKMKTFGVIIQLQLVTKDDSSLFYLIDWQGPEIETGLHFRSARSMDELDAIASDLNNAKFKGSIYTKDGKNVLTLSEDELRQYFSEDTDLTLDKKIEILNARLEKGKKDGTVATIVLDSMPKENDIVKDSEQAAKFIAEFADVLKWSYISRYMNLPESFMVAYADKLDWKWISTKGNLSDAFIKQFADKLNIKDVANSQTLSKSITTYLKKKNLL